MRCQLFVVFAILTSHSARSEDAKPTPNFDKIFDYFKERLNFATDYAVLNCKNCKPIEDSDNEIAVIQNRTKSSAKFQLTEQEVSTFIRAQLDAIKLVQYNLVVKPSELPPKPNISDYNELHDKITVLGDNIMPVIKPALDEVKLFKDKDECLLAISKKIDPQQSKETTVMKVALFRAASLFTDACLKAPLCKPAN